MRADPLTIVDGGGGRIPTLAGLAAERGAVLHHAVPKPAGHPARISVDFATFRGLIALEAGPPVERLKREFDQPPTAGLEPIHGVADLGQGRRLSELDQDGSDLELLVEQDIDQHGTRTPRRSA